MKNEVEQSVLKQMTPLVEQLGYELVDVEYKKEENGMNLTVFIHKAGGITLEDCQTVAQALDAPLDELNPTHDEHYYFNVSSVGLDRPLTTEKDFFRNLGVEVDVTYKTDDKTKTIRGAIKTLENGTLTINEKGKLTQIPFKDVISALVVIKF